MPRFSVCMPVYNTGKYLDEAIKSILNQTFSDLELIIVDDCSTDDSYKIAESCAEKDDRVKLYKNDVNSGPLKSLLKAFANSSGEIMMFLDSDDYLDPDTLETVNKELKKTNTDLLVYGYRKFNNETKKIERQTSNIYELYDESKKGELLYRLATENDFNGLSRKAIKGDICRNTEVIEERKNIIRGNDKLLSAAIYKHVSSGVIIPDIKYNYRDNSTGLTRTGETSKYNIEYRDKEEMAEVIFDSNAVSKELKDKYINYEFKQFISQLMKISNLNISYADKVNLFETIKKDDYYVNHLKTIIINKNNRITNEFIRCKYQQLIRYFRVRKKLSLIFK